MIGLLLIALLLGIAEFGRALFIRNQLAFAADIAARQILIHPTAAASDLESAVRDAITYDQGELQLEFGAEVVDGLSFRTISLRQPLTLLVPDIYEGSIMLSAERRVPLH